MLLAHCVMGNEMGVGRQGWGDRSGMTQGEMLVGCRVGNKVKEIVVPEKGSVSQRGNCLAALSCGSCRTLFLLGQ